MRNGPFLHPLSEIRTPLSPTPFHEFPALHKADSGSLVFNPLHLVFMAQHVRWTGNFLKERKKKGKKEMLRKKKVVFAPPLPGNFPAAAPGFIRGWVTLALPSTRAC